MTVKFYHHLRQFIDTLEKNNDVIRIKRSVSTELEISRLTDEQSKSERGGKALYFENVRGSVFPVVTNIFGSLQRIQLALGVKDLDEIAHRISAFTKFHPPRGLRDALHMVPMAMDMTRFPPRRYRKTPAPCQQAIYLDKDVDLSIIPIIKCWPKDAGKFITLPLVVTRSLETGVQNMGMYRMQVFDKNTTGMHWHIHKDGSHYYQEYGKKNQMMPVSVAIGSDPATIYAATAPMPRGVDELLLAGFIRKQPVRTVRCITNDLLVPAEAEFVIEGYVNPGELRREGPFGDHTGYYSPADDYPVFHVTAITHRRHPIYCTTLVGRPPMEDCYLAKATERIFLPLLKTVFPEIIDYHFPWEGVFHNIVIVSIEKEFAGHAQKIMNGLWGQGQMSFCKTIVVMDSTIRADDLDAVLNRLLTCLDTQSDIIITKGILDVLDHASPFADFGSKIGIDLTRRFAGELPRRRWEEASGSSSTINEPFLMDDRELTRKLSDGLDWITECRFLNRHHRNLNIPCRRILAISADKKDSHSGSYIAEKLFNDKWIDYFHIIILFDAGMVLNDNSRLLWKLFNNVDPGRDIYIRAGRIIIDACRKGKMDGHDRQWPEELSFDQ